MNQRAQELQPVAQTGRANQPVLIPPDGLRLSPFIPRGSNRFRDLYHRRGAVERELGRLKNHYGLAPLRVRGLERVQLTRPLHARAAHAGAPSNRGAGARRLNE